MRSELAPPMRPSGLRSPNPSLPPSDDVDVEEDAVDKIDETLFRNPPTAHHAPTPLTPTPPPAHPPTPTPPLEEEGRPEARGEEDEEEEQVLAVDPKE